MDIKINVDDDEVQGILEALDRAYKDFRPYLKEISKVQLDSADESFKTRGTNLGRAWDRLAISTTKRKIRIGKNIDILQRTGTMRKSFRVEKLDPNELEIGNTVKYYKYHQQGTKKMPQRQMLGHSPALIKQHEIAFIDYILKTIKK